jgi:general secretion pathway protein G
MKKQTKTKATIYNDEGWTFMETLIVIAIVLVLTASVGFVAVNSLDNARRASTQAQIDSFCIALEAYYIDCGFYPSEEQGLGALRNKPTIEPVSEKWNGPYLYKNIPADPWGNLFMYTNPGRDGDHYGISSYGADGTEGGEEKNADITSWEN